jgi:acetoacetyl-CoA synthetase
MLHYGLKPGDRVASYSSNCIVRVLTSSIGLPSLKCLSQENVAACLATTAIGGIWVSAAADFGPEGVLERYGDIIISESFLTHNAVWNKFNQLSCSL